MDDGDAKFREYNDHLLQDLRPGCVQHGFCPGCMFEELERRVKMLEERVNELEGHQVRDSGRAS